jgi:hypothetical protein
MTESQAIQTNECINALRTAQTTDETSEISRCFQFVRLTLENVQNEIRKELPGCKRGDQHEDQ